MLWNAHTNKTGDGHEREGSSGNAACKAMLLARHKLSHYDYSMFLLHPSIMATSVHVQRTGVTQWLQIAFSVNCRFPLFDMLSGLVKLVQSNCNHPRGHRTVGVDRYALVL